MSIDGNPQVLIIGSGVIATELAAAYAQLGFESVIGPLASAASLKPRLIVTATDDFDLEELRHAAEATGAETVPTIEASELTANRQRTRASANDDLGLPTLEHEFVTDPAQLAEAAERIGFPCVVKPGRSTDGTGQSVVREPGELDAAYRAALEASPGEGVVVERYIQFDSEVTILAVRSVDPATGELATWFCEPIGTRHERGRLVQSFQPAQLTEAAMDNARSIAARVTGAMNSCGVHSVELFIDGEEVYFSQATPRPTLDGMVTRATQRLDQFELHARASLRLPIDATLISPGASQLVPTEGRAVTTECLARAMAVEETGVQVLASALLMRSTGETAEEAQERAARAAAAL
ncbi:ATP-grasp domain-containing protein [Corynebacterium bouchesdurhonense]|uniref:ATP-grasp domain-containing protein n=1 Tax=Corynebacterium bouchesdurhonense TaxID=1720192 RepID=UPI00082F59C3|nr:ATP-grasp domain-containing protein [Corynebacterium bouchesdurhonense]